MYIKSPGSHPVGEAYMTPPNSGGDVYIMSHYYSGGESKMIKLSRADEPIKSTDLEKRVKALEKWKENFTKYTEFCLKKLYEKAGMETDYKTFKEWAGENVKEEPEKESEPEEYECDYYVAEAKDPRVKDSD